MRAPAGVCREHGPGWLPTRFCPKKIAPAEGYSAGAGRPFIHDDELPRCRPARQSNHRPVRNRVYDKPAIRPLIQGQQAGPLTPEPFPGLRRRSGQFQVELLLEDLETRRAKRKPADWGRGGCLDAQRQQGQQDGDRLLLEPRSTSVSGSSIDAAAQRFGQRHGHLDGAVGVVALAHVKQAREAGHRAVVT